jgi:hypothetical protein
MRFRHALSLAAAGTLVLAATSLSGPQATAEGFGYHDLKPWQQRLARAPSWTPWPSGPARPDRLQTREPALVLCPGTGEPGVPPRTCTAPMPQADPANEQEIFTARRSVF